MQPSSQLHNSICYEPPDTDKSKLPYFITWASIHTWVTSETLTYV